MKTSTLIFALALLSTAAAAQTRLNYGTLRWSDDGRKLLFSCIEVNANWSNYSPYNWKLYVYDLKRKDLELVDRAAQYGAFSPDGEKVVYSKNSGFSWDIFILDLASGSKQKVTDTPQDETAPDWSPDGRMIAFTMKLKKGVSSIYSMDTQGGNVRNLSRNGDFECLNPEFSPDGERLAYYMDRGDKKDQVYVMEIYSGFARNVTRDNNHNIFPGWFDNQSLIYTRANEEVCIKEIDGSAPVPVDGIQSYLAKYNARQSQIAYINREDQSIYVRKLKGRPGRLKLGKAGRVVSPEVVKGE